LEEKKEKKENEKTFLKRFIYQVGHYHFFPVPRKIEFF